jgi:hypothetical protein
MILSASYYNIMGRKGLLLFHQKCESASSHVYSQRIFSIFENCYTEILSDVESTQVPSSDDMDEPEIQLLENAKARTLKSLPQSSLYWGSELYHLHINKENVFAKIPLWFHLHRVKNNELVRLELDHSWTKLARDKDESFILSPNVANISSRRLLGESDFKNAMSFRVANFISTPLLNIPPSLTIDSRLVSDA